MKYVKSSSSFFEESSQAKDLANLLKSVPTDVWEALSNSNLEYEPVYRGLQYHEAQLTHQLSLLEAFDDVNQMNECENLLTRHGYDPVLLNLENAYFETVDALYSLNESVWSKVKDFFNTWTEGGSPIGLLQFTLDIIGMLPAAWTFGISTVANVLNALISFYRGNYISGVINIIMAFDLTGALAAPFKVAFKSLGRVGEKIGEVLFKTGAKLDDVAIDAMIKTAGKGPVGIVGSTLKTIGTSILKAGGRIIEELVRLLQKVFAWVPGSEAAAAKIVKKISEFNLRLSEVGAKATEVGGALTKAAEAPATKAATGALARAEAGAAASAKAGGAAAKDAAEIGAYMAGKPAGEIATIGKEAAEAAAKEIEQQLTAKGFSKEVINSVKNEPGYRHLIDIGAEKQTLNLYARAAATRKAVSNVLNVNSEKSFVKMLDDPELLKILDKTGARPAEKALVDAINSGDKAAITKMFDDVLANPEAVKFIAKNEPAVAKTLNLFRSSPNMLISGAQNFKKIEKTLIKLGKMPKFKYRMSTGMQLLSRFVAMCSARYFRSECAVSPIQNPLNFMGGALSINPTSPEQLIGNAMLGSLGATNNSVATQENLSIFEEQTPDQITQADLDKLKESNPDAYQTVMDEITKAKSETLALVKKTTPADPCANIQDASVAAVGSTLEAPDENSFSNSAFNTETPAGVTDIKSAADADKAGITSQQKQYLKALDLPTDIDPQHETTKFDPVIKAYFSDTWDFSSNKFSINTDDKSRLDKTVNDMVQDGSLPKDQAGQLKSQIETHWANDTQPAEVKKLFSDINESLSPFKIKKFITKL